VRDLVVTENITLDGVNRRLRRAGSPSPMTRVSDQSDLQAALGEQSGGRRARSASCRVSFRNRGSRWAPQTRTPDRPATTGGERLPQPGGQVRGLRHLDDPQWEADTVLPGHGFQDELRALKASRGRDIVTTGSITLSTP
jgi:hypothetical protein